MSVIQRIRDRGAWIIFSIIALALIAFIMQDSSLRRGSFFSNNSVLGSVNGEKIERTDYQSKLDFFDNMSKQRGQEMPRGMLSGQVWNYMIQQSLLNQEIKKTGIGFTSRELADVLFGDNPPQWMQQQFTDPKTGIFDVNAARQQFSQIKKNSGDPRVQNIYQQFIEPTVQQTLFQKYNALLTGAVYIPKWIAEKTNADNNSIAKASYVYIPYTAINDSTIKVSDDEINAYVKKHEKQYRREEETRTVSYVSFSESPTAADSALVKNDVTALQHDFTVATDVKSFLNVKGTDRTYSDNYILKSGFKNANADTIMSLPVGSLYGPYIDNGEYILAKMVNKRTIPDSVKCRHILIKTDENGKPLLADSIAKKRIDSIAAAIQGGADFNSMVQKYSDDAGSKATAGEYTFPYEQFGSISKEFAETIFYETAGTKKTVKVANQGYAGYHYIEVLNQYDMQEAYNVAYLAKPIVASTETINAASTAAAQFASSGRDQKSFEANAKKIGKLPLPSQDIHTNDYSLNVINGENREFIKWIFSHDQGDVSDPAELGDQYVVAMITAVNKEGLPSAKSVRPTVEVIVRNNKKAKSIIESKIKGSTLEAIAQSNNVTVQHADSLAFQSSTLTGVGFEPKIIGAAFNKQSGTKISQAIAGGSGVFVVKSEGVSATASLNGSPDQEKAAIKNMIMQQQNNSMMDALRKSATVKDNRADFF